MTKISLCSSCISMTKTINGFCGKCKADKRDYYFILAGTAELLDKMEKAGIHTEPIYLQKVNKKSKFGKQISGECFERLT